MPRIPKELIVIHKAGMTGSGMSRASRRLHPAEIRRRAFRASALSILGGRGRCALRGGERHTLQELERLLELEVLFRGELERRRGFFFGIRRRFCTGPLRFLRLDLPLLVVEE